MYRIAICSLLLFSSHADATSYARPQRHDVFSSNRAFVLDVNPSSKVHTVYAAEDRTKPLWSFTKPVWLGPLLLSNDGSTVATVAWEHVRSEDVYRDNCVEFYNRDGMLKAYPFLEVCPAPARTILVTKGPIGFFWRTWYTECEQDGDTFRIRTTDRFEYVFSLADGTIVSRRFILTTMFYKLWFDALLVVVAVALFLWIRHRRRRKLAT